MIRLLPALLLIGTAVLAQADPQVASPSVRPPAEDVARQFEQAVTLLESRGDVAAAARLFETIANGRDRPLASRALVYLGDCYERLGDGRARDAYARVIEHFAEQTSAVSRARVRLARLPKATARPGAVLRLRRFWTTSPLPETDIGTVSLDGRSLGLFDAQGVVTLQDMQTGRLSAPRQLGRGTAGSPCVAMWSLVLAPDASAAVFSCQVEGDAFELRWASLSRAASQERLLQRAGAGDMIEPVEWRRPGEVLTRVTHSDRTSSLVLVSLAATSPRTVVTLPFVPAHASISPDGRWVAYDGPDSGTPPRRDVLVVPATGGKPRLVAGGPSDDLLPVWTGHGQGLTWVSDRTGTSGLWFQAIVNGVPVDTPRLLAPDLGRIAQPLALTASGAYAYFRQTGLVDVNVVHLDATGRPGGRPSVEGTRYVGATMSPTWSRDGRRLAYRVELGVSRVHAIGVRETTTLRERIVAPAMSWIDMPRWSPDGTRLLARGSGMTAGYGFFLIDAESGATTALKIVPLMEEDTLGPGQWDASGNAVIYFRHGAFIRLNVDTRQEERLFALPEGVRLAALPDPGFSVSPDDGRLAYVQIIGGVTTLVVRGQDGGSRELVRSRAGERLAGVTWGSFGRTLYFTRIATDHSLPPESQWPAVWMVDLATGDTSALGIAMPRLRGLAASPDGTRLAFTSGSPTREPWILEHFLPAHPVAARRPGR